MGADLACRRKQPIPHRCTQLLHATAVVPARAADDRRPGDGVGKPARPQQRLDPGPGPVIGGAGRLLHAGRRKINESQRQAGLPQGLDEKGGQAVVDRLVAPRRRVLARTAGRLHAGAGGAEEGEDQSGANPDQGIPHRRLVPGRRVDLRTHSGKAFAPLLQARGIGPHVSNRPHTFFHEQAHHLPARKPGRPGYKGAARPRHIMARRPFLCRHGFLCLEYLNEKDAGLLR